MPQLCFITPDGEKMLARARRCAPRERLGGGCGSMHGRGGYGWDSMSAKLAWTLRGWGGNAWRSPPKLQKAGEIGKCTHS
jgi:hypothetical protein